MTGVFFSSILFLRDFLSVGGEVGQKWKTVCIRKVYARMRLINT